MLDQLEKEHIMTWKTQLKKKDQFKKNQKKIDCKAKFQVSFDPEDRNNVTIKYACEHNHTIGSFEDMKHSTLSSALKELIELQLSLGYDKRDVRVSLQKHFSNSFTSTHRDHFVHADKIYNIYLKIQQKKYKLKDNLFESVEAWLKDLSNEGYSTYKSPSFYTS